MKSLFKFHQNYVNASARYSAKQSELRKKRDEIEKEIRDAKYPHFTNYLKQLGKELLPHIKGASKVTIYGPFGLGCETSIYFENKNGKTVASATFTRYGDGYGIKNYSVNTGHYRTGTIGEINGMNHPTIEIKKDMSMDWFLKYIKRHRNK